MCAADNGIINDWEVLEALWSHIFSDRLRAPPEEFAMMIAEPSHNTREAREKTVELMFEKFGPPALFLAKNAVLSSFASGRQTSLVVDAGKRSKRLYACLNIIMRAFCNCVLVITCVYVGEMLLAVGCLCPDSTVLVTCIRCNFTFGLRSSSFLMSF